MKKSDFSIVQFIEEDLEIKFDYKGFRYSLFIDFDDEGFIVPKFFHKTIKENNIYACSHCSQYTNQPKLVNKNGYRYTISPYDSLCMYLNPIANKPMKFLFQSDEVKKYSEIWLSKIKK